MSKFLTNFIIFGFVLVSLGLINTKVEAATLSLLPSSGNLTVNQDNNVQVIVNTQSANIVGIDAIINYDPAKVTITGITQGTLFLSYPTKTYTGGQIKISALDSTFTTPYNGSNGVLATIRVRPIVTGPINLTFSYTAQSTTDSNVVEQTTTTDLLSSVTNGSYTSITTSNPTSNSGTVLPKTAFGSSMTLPLEVEIGILAVISILLVSFTISSSYRKVALREKD
jgi:hypothetical protein